MVWECGFLKQTTILKQTTMIASDQHKPPRICFYPDRLESGIGRVTLNLAEAMLERGIEVDIMLTKRSGKLVDQLPNGVRVIEGKGSVRHSLGTLYNYLRQEQPSALITAHTYVNIAAIALSKISRSRTRVMVTIHTATSRDDQSGTPVRKSLYSLLARFFYPLADHIVAVSSAVADDLAAHLRLRRDRIDVIYNPVVTQAMKDKAAQPVDHPFFAAGVPVIVSIGRLTEQKDYPTLLRAFADLRCRMPCKLLILGEGGKRPELEQLVAELELSTDVALPGFVQNPYAYLAKARLFVSSSAWEGLPTVIIEALALGVPVVATDCPGGTSEILAGGQFGTLVPVSEPQVLSRAIQHCLTAVSNPQVLVDRASIFTAEASATHYLQSLRLA